MSPLLHLRTLVASLALAALLAPSAHAAMADKTITLTNTGNGPLTITTAAQPISGNTAEYALTGNTCSSVAVGASCALTVRFTPTGSGTRPAAALNFTSNGTNGPTHSIALTGTGGASCTAGKQVFSYTGADRVIQVPGGCSMATIKAWGAGGRAGTPNVDSGLATRGGGGGFAQRTLSNLAAGATLVVVVGQGGASSAATYGGGGGGNYSYSAAGGGLSGVFSSSKSQANAILIAGGGGGGMNNTGGYGGGVQGGSPQTFGAPYYDGIFYYWGGKGGTQTAGGQGGGMEAPGAWPGGALVGGAGWTGGGGGGYWGGGGSEGQAGGGGSGYAPGGTLIAGSGCAVANSSDPDYGAGIGNGGCSQNTPGQNGRVVIQWGP